MGKVYLIGAGPGDQGLITIKGVSALKKCDVIVYDRLASKALLKYTKEDAEIYYCGKEPGCHYKTQEEINEILVHFGKTDKIVGRLKGGDPYVFGRGGEEALALKKEGIEFEVIPGVTSSIAALNYAGIPITHRGVSQSIHIITGKTAEDVSIPWDALAKLKGTLVFMMGYRALGKITTNLIKAGMGKNTKAAVVMWGTTSKQNKAIGNLENIVDICEERKISSPSIIAIGEVVSLSEDLNWFENKPLFGENILITRSKSQSKVLADKILSLGGDVSEFNSIEFTMNEEELSKGIKHIEEFDYIIMNSVNGVKMFFQYLKKNKIDIRKVKGEFCAVGKKTAKEIEKNGIMVWTVADEFSAEGLVEKLKGLIKKGSKVLSITSNLGKGYTKDKLKLLGIDVCEIQAYNTIKGNNTRAVDDSVTTVFFTSPSSVKNTIEAFGKEYLESKRIIAIGPVTANEIKNNNLKCYVAEEYTQEGMIDKLINVKQIEK